MTRLPVATHIGQVCNGTAACGNIYIGQVVNDTASSGYTYWPGSQ